MASDEWRNNLTANLVSDLSFYPARDYRRFLSAHLQFLDGLCELSNETVNNSINQFLTSLFITGQLLSQKDFEEHIASLIRQSTLNISISIAPLLSLIQSINHGNAIISTFGTNFEYFLDSYNSEVYTTFMPTQAILYDNECSCGLYSNCTSQANFIKANSSEIVPIKGLKIGCTPSESFRSSTLECFYDFSCVNLIQEYTNYTHSIIPLSATMNRSTINTTIADLINDLFVDQWSTTMNYSSYFEQCSPILCSYTYIQQFNPLYTVTFLLGLQGGLMIVLKWICPQIVRLIANLHRHRKNRMNIVRPERSFEITPIEIVNKNVSYLTVDLNSIPSQYIFFFIFILFIIYRSFH